MPDGEITRQQLDLDIAKFLTGLQQADAALKKFSETSHQTASKMAAGFTPLLQTFSKIKNELSGVLAGLVGGLSVAGVINFAKAMGTAGEQISHMTDQLGLSAEQVQGYEVLLNREGQGVESLNTMFRRLSQSLVEAHDPMSEAARHLNTLGVSQDAIRHGSVDTVIRQIADGMSKLDDPTRAADAATQVLGRSALALIPAFKNGSAAIDEALTSSKRFGELSQVQVSALNSMDKAFDDLTLQVKRWSEILAADLSPIVKSLIQSFLDLIDVMGKIGSATGVGAAMGQAMQLVAGGIAVVVTMAKNAVIALGAMADTAEALAHLDLGKIGEITNKAIAGYDANRVQMMEQLRNLRIIGAAREGDKDFIGPLPQKKTGGAVSDRDPRGDLKRALEHEVVMRAEALKAEEIHTHSRQALRDRFFEHVSALRTKDLALEGVTAEKRAEIIAKYKNIEDEFVKKQNAERLKEDVEALTKYGEDVRKKEQERLDAVSEIANSALAIEKERGSDRLTIYKITMDAIDLEERAAVNKVREYEHQVEAVRTAASAKRLEAVNAFYQASLKSTAELARAEFDAMEKNPAALTGNKIAAFQAMVRAQLAVKLEEVGPDPQLRAAAEIDAKTKVSEFTANKLREDYELQIRGQVLLGEEQKKHHAQELADQQKLMEGRLAYAEKFVGGRENIEQAHHNLQMARMAVELNADGLTATQKLEIFERYAREKLEKRGQLEKAEQDLQNAGATAQFEQDRKTYQDRLNAMAAYQNAEVTEATNAMLSLEEVSRRKVAALEAERAARLAALPTEGDQTMNRAAIEIEMTSRINREIEQGQGNLLAGLKRGWYTYMTDLGNVFNFAVDFARRTADMMTQAFSTMFFDAFKGNITSLKDLMQSFSDFFMKLAADIAARLLTLFIMQKSLGLFGGGLFGGGGPDLHAMGLASEGGWIGAPKYKFGGPTFPDADAYPALLRRGEFVLNPTGVDTLSKINQGNGLNATPSTINVSITNHGAEKGKPQVNVREGMRGLIIDVILRDIAANGPLRGLGMG